MSNFGAVCDAFLLLLKDAGVRTTVGEAARVLHDLRHNFLAIGRMTRATPRGIHGDFSVLEPVARALHQSLESWGISNFERECLDNFVLGLAKAGIANELPGQTHLRFALCNGLLPNILEDLMFERKRTCQTLDARKMLGSAPRFRLRRKCSRSLLYRPFGILFGSADPRLSSNAVHVVRSRLLKHAPCRFCVPGGHARSVCESRQRVAISHSQCERLIVEGAGAMIDGERGFIRYRIRRKSCCPSIFEQPPSRTRRSNEASRSLTLRSSASYTMEPSKSYAPGFMFGAAEPSRCQVRSEQDHSDDDGWGDIFGSPRDLGWKQMDSAACLQRLISTDALMNAENETSNQKAVLCVHRGCHQFHPESSPKGPVVRLRDLYGKGFDLLCRMGFDPRWGDTLVNRDTWITDTAAVTLPAGSRGLSSSNHVDPHCDGC